MLNKVTVYPKLNGGYKYPIKQSYIYWILKAEKDNLHAIN